MLRLLRMRVHPLLLLLRPRRMLLEMLLLRCVHMTLLCMGLRLLLCSRLLLRG